jgi:hypothetical protein
MRGIGLRWSVGRFRRSVRRRSIAGAEGTARGLVVTERAVFGILVVGAGSVVVTFPTPGDSLRTHRG